MRERERTNKKKREEKKWMSRLWQPWQAISCMPSWKNGLRPQPLTSLLKVSLRTARPSCRNPHCARSRQEDIKKKNSANSPSIKLHRPGQGKTLFLLQSGDATVRSTKEDRYPLGLAKTYILRGTRGPIQHKAGNRDRQFDN